MFHYVKLFLNGMSFETYIFFLFMVELTTNKTDCHDLTESGVKYQKPIHQS